MGDSDPLEGNLRAAMCAYALSTDEGEVRHLPGVTVVNSGVDFSVFNAALLSEPVSTTEGELVRRIIEARFYYSARNLPWSFWLSEGMLEAESWRTAGDVLRRERLRSVSEPLGMIAPRLEPARRKLPSLDFRRVADEQTRLAFCEITSTVFQLPYAVSRRVYGGARIWRGELAGYVGYLDGSAISTVATLTAAGAVGVYSLATLPDRQGRGYGEAILRHAVESAQRSSGLDRSVLQATQAGIALYRRLGFQESLRFAVHIASLE